MRLSGVGGTGKTAMFVHTECATLSRIGARSLRPTSEEAWICLSLWSPDVARSTAVAGVAILLTQITGMAGTGASRIALET